MCSWLALILFQDLIFFEICQKLRKFWKNLEQFSSWVIYKRLGVRFISIQFTDSSIQLINLNFLQLVKIQYSMQFLF